MSKIGSQEGVELDRSRTARAAQVRCDYAQANRLELLNRGFDKAAEILERIGDAGPDARQHPAEALRHWTIAVGVLIDKRRLEDGEATSRGERVTVEDRQAAGREVEGLIDELAERRAWRTLPAAE